MVAEVAPRREQHAARAVFFRGGASFANVRERICLTRAETEPRRSSRRDEKSAGLAARIFKRGANAGALRIERMSGIIAPNHGNAPAQKIRGNGTGFAEQNVRPKLNFFSASLRARFQSRHVLKINGALAAFFAKLAGTPLPELPRLVAADIEIFRRKIRQILAVKFAHEIRRILARSKRSRRAMHFENFVKKSVGALCKRFVARMPKPTLNMSERIEIRHELDPVSAAECIERTNFRRRQRRRITPNFLVLAKRERVFNVELKPIVAQRGKHAHQALERCRRRHAPARNIEHKPALGKRGNGIFRKNLQIFGNVHAGDFSANARTKGEIRN